MMLTPAQLGYRMPAEWEPHEATWIAWPHNRDDWPGKFAPIPWVYAEIVRNLSRVENVFIVVAGGRMKRRAADILDRAGVNVDQVHFVKAATDRVWLRDSGPTFVVRDLTAQGQTHDAPAPGPIGLLDWKFNAWAKYDNHSKRQQHPAADRRELGLHRWVPRVNLAGKPVRVVLEGGAIDVNGQGSLLTTEECLLSEVQARNPGLGRAEHGKSLRRFPERQPRDLARTEGSTATTPTVTSTTWPGSSIPEPSWWSSEPHSDDANHEPLQENLRRLESATDQDGKPLRVVTLPMPEPIVFDSQRLPASYANFYIANQVVLVPTFNDPNDRIALDTLAALFPDRRVVGIHSVDLVLGLGTLHCLSQQQPMAGHSQVASNHRGA